MAAFLDVIFRGMALAGQAIAIGGVLFALLVQRTHDTAAARRTWTCVAAGATLVIVAQGLALVILTGALQGHGSLLSRLIETQYFRATVARILAAGVLLLGALAVRRAPPASSPRSPAGSSPARFCS